MNELRVGLRRSNAPPRKGSYLFMHDEVPDLPLAKVFDPARHSLDPLRTITKQQARDLARVLYAAAPEGANTLTVRNGRRSLAPALFAADRFDLVKPEGEGADEAKAMIDDLLFIPVLNSVLTGERPIFPLKKDTVILARLDRAQIGDEAAFVIGSILITLFKGQLVIPDFGFYGRDAHVSLIRQNRLIAGINFLAELPLSLRSAVLLMQRKKAAGALYDDAITLAKHAGLQPDPTRDDNPFNAFVRAAMSSDGL